MRALRRLVLLALAVAPAVPAAGALPDGAQRFFAWAGASISWSEHSTVVLHDAVAGDALLVGVGEWEPIGGPPRHLHWKAFDAAGHPVVGCTATSGSLFPFSLSASSRGRAALIESSGRLVVGGAMSLTGSETQDRPLLARFELDETTCTLDETLHSLGWMLLTPDECDGKDCSVVGVAELRPATGAVSSPRLVALLRVTVNSLVTRYFIVRLTFAGSLDTAFGDGGYAEVTAPSLGNLGGPASMTLDARGRIYTLVGRYDPASGADLDVYLLRFTPSGDLDIGFGDGGAMAMFDHAPPDDFDTVAGQIVVADDGSLFASGGDLAFVSRVTTRRADGTPLGDYSFGPVPAALLAWQGNRRLLILHEPDSGADEFDVSRWAPPYVDESWGTYGGSAYDVDLGGDDGQSVVRALLFHGRLVVAGTADTDAGSAGFFVGAENGYVFANGFEGSTVAPWSQASGF